MPTRCADCGSPWTESTYCPKCSEIKYDDDQCADPDCRHFREHHGNRGCEQGGYDRKGHDIDCLCREFQEEGSDASR